MTDSIWQRAEIESPCVKICLMDPEHKICVGCGRTSAEIAGWSRFSPEQRAAIMNLLSERLETAKPQRRGGRSRKMR